MWRAVCTTKKRSKSIKQRKRNLGINSFRHTLAEKEVASYTQNHVYNTTNVYCIRRTPAWRYPWYRYVSFAYAASQWDFRWRWSLHSPWKLQMTWIRVNVLRVFSPPLGNCVTEVIDNESHWMRIFSRKR